MDTSAHTVKLSGQSLTLPRKEYMLLKALMENQEGYNQNNNSKTNFTNGVKKLASNAIEVHIHHLRKKFPNDFIKTLRGIGYVVGKR
ncbi:winged helix-turn-helix domain-containing protein [Pseudoalteromonas sp. B193]